MILGILHEDPLSGYDLRQLFRDTPLKSYSSSPGSIYPALKSLEKRGLVRAAPSGSARGGEKRVFHVTAAGEAALAEWLRSAPEPGESGNRYDGTFEAKLAFMSHFMTTAEIAELCARYLEQVRAELATVAAYRAQHEEELPLSGLLALDGGIAKIEATMHWLERALKTLDGWNEGMETR